MTIDYDKDLTPYRFHERFTEKERPHSLSRWVSWAIFNFRQIYSKVDLQSIFGDTEVIILGFPGSDADEEADLIFNSIFNLQREKVRIYKFRHIDEKGYLYRSLSYAVLVCSENSSRRFWIVFPDSCGLDSGGAYGSYLNFEKLIKFLEKKISVEVKRFDVPYDVLESFLIKKSTCFHSSIKGIDCIHPEINFPFCPKILENSSNQFNIFVKSFDNKEYAQALRDLRALIQQAEENIVKEKMPSYEVDANTNVTKLAKVLVEKNLLQGKTIPWVEAFCSIANQSSHKDFPSAKDMEDSIIHKRTMLTFETGLEILEELNAILFPPISFKALVPTIKIKKERV